MKTTATKTQEPSHLKKTVASTSKGISEKDLAKKQSKLFTT